MPGGKTNGDTLGWLCGLMFGMAVRIPVKILKLAMAVKDNMGILQLTSYWYDGIDLLLSCFQDCS